MAPHETETTRPRSMCTRDKIDYRPAEKYRDLGLLPSLDRPKPSGKRAPTKPAPRSTTVLNLSSSEDAEEKGEEDVTAPVSVKSSKRSYHAMGMTGDVHNLGEESHKKREKQEKAEASKKIKSVARVLVQNAAPDLDLIATGLEEKAQGMKAVANGLEKEAEGFRALAEIARGLEEEACDG